MSIPLERIVLVACVVGREDGGPRERDARAADDLLEVDGGGRRRDVRVVDADDGHESILTSDAIVTRILFASGNVTVT